MFRQGVVCGVIGMVVLLAALVIWRRMEGKQPVRLDGKTLGHYPGSRRRRPAAGGRDVPVHGV